MAQATSPSQLRLIWGKCRTDALCELNNVDLSNSAFSQAGVYVIWYISKKGNIKIVRVGQAEVLRERLADHQDNDEIQDCAKGDTVHVTWAQVGAGQRDGVEVYPGRELKPKLGERFPDAEPIAVNLPSFTWSAD
jgi:hypothetical protein